jgi:hypothetical protein
LSEAYNHALRVIHSAMRFLDVPHAERWKIEIASQDRIEMIVLFPPSPYRTSSTAMQRLRAAWSSQDF